MPTINVRAIEKLDRFMAMFCDELFSLIFFRFLSPVLWQPGSAVSGRGSFHCVLSL